jgi:glycosyltransferase involved in cell wall biosynthesis
MAATTSAKANVYPMTEPGEPLRVLFAAPAYWPATAFGGPIPVMRELAAGLAHSGCTVDVITTSLTSTRGPRSKRTRIEPDDGSTIAYAATPFSYRWMGLTPTVPVWLERRPRPDVVHVFGFRDPVGTMVAAWCLAHGVPYVFEALGMFKPKLRKVGLKRALDATVFRHVPTGAARVIACSGLERDEYIAGGVARQRIALRPNGFPLLPAVTPGALRSVLGIPAETTLVLSVGRIADGKGLDLLIHGLAGCRGSHLALVGPDDGHGTSAALRRLSLELGVRDRVHFLGAREHGEVLRAYADADVVALTSAHESFGMVAAEAAAAGKAILLTDRCGVAELLGPDGALIIPFDREAVKEGLEALLRDPTLRRRLGQQAKDVAGAWSWQRVVGLQRAVYEEVMHGVTATD